MAYTDFTLADLNRQFGVTNQIGPLFGPVSPVIPTAFLRESLARGQRLRLRNEKIKSEAIVYPVLTDVLDRQTGYFTLFSGENLPALRERGLTGECDFLITKDTLGYEPDMPIVSVVEAKRNDFEAGVPQCAAQLVGANLFNSALGHPVAVLYGCVTTADQWLFLRLADNHLTIDNQKYALSNLETLLGIFDYILQAYRRQSENDGGLTVAEERPNYQALWLGTTA